ncbi:SIMPL domain-containing protein [Streptomyces sp. NPDC048290]|uniref:SIMPL domain-containing protein n=1 Tax=Streptomyces sp. NPDC048290 TaxID=3155811 RepID=UPI0034219232
MTPPTPLPYGTPDTPHITVTGEAHLDTAPDTAHLTLTLTARGRDRHTTLNNLTHRNTTTLNLLHTYDTAIEHIETSTLTLTPQPTKGRGEHIRAHQGTLHLTAHLTDFTPLGELTTRLADHEHTHIDGITWTLRPDSPAHRQARHQAVHNAIQRARAYAEALGTTLTALTELTDTEIPQPYPPTTLRTATHTTEATHTPPLDLEPQRQHLYATITARFTMNPPTL